MESRGACRSLYKGENEGLRFPVRLMTWVLACAALFSAARVPPVRARQAKGADAQTPSARESERDRRLRWFREARFGLMIHWGLYAVPAGEWKVKPVAGLGAWSMN